MRKKAKARRSAYRNSTLAVIHRHRAWNLKERREAERSQQDDNTCTPQKPIEAKRIVRTFPERLGSVYGIHCIWPWLLLTIGLVVVRVVAMYNCGEAAGRYPINIISCCVPGALALLIVYYASRMERLEKSVCRFVCDPEEKVCSWYAEEVRLIFSNRGMAVFGVILAVLLVLLNFENALYPTVTNNDAHVQKVLDGTKIHFGQLQGDLNATIGWTELSVGHARKMAAENKGLLLMDVMKMPFRTRVGIGKDVTHQRKLNDTPAWRFSRAVYIFMTLLVGFMGGAMTWCQFRLILFSIRLVNKAERNLRMDVFPHPGVGIKAVGKFFGMVALFSSLIYVTSFAGLLLSRPDWQSLFTIALFGVIVVSIFLVPQYYLHDLMLKTKYDKISPLGDALEAALKLARSDPSKRNIQTAQSILQLQHSLTFGSEWPFDMQALLAVIGSVVLPLLMVVLAVFEQAN